MCFFAGNSVGNTSNHFCIITIYNVLGNKKLVPIIADNIIHIVPLCKMILSQATCNKPDIKV